MLRGINVGGARNITMAALKALYESLGFTGVVTYIQSGNVIFRAKEKNASSVSESIADGIGKKFGFEVTVIVRQPAELASVVKKNPFVGRRGIDETRLHVTFLRETPSAAFVKALAPLTAKSRDEHEVIGREIYLHCPNGYSKTLLNNTFFEKNLKVAATTRNWNTVKTLHSIARGETT